MSEFRPTIHPVLTMPTADEAAALGAEGWRQALLKREEIIRHEVENPLYGCWESPIWRVCDALLGVPWMDEKEAERIRLNLKFKQPVNVILINGGWASSKTEYAANRTSRLMQRTPNGLTWFFHQTLNSSRDQQQPLIWKYLPPGLRGSRPILTAGTYVAYKVKTGFSDENFVLPNLHRGRCWTYDGGIDKLQGPTVNAAWADELITPDFVQAIRSRVSRSNGWFFITFAPIEGYTNTVQEFWDGAEVVRESTAFLNPDDNGPRDVARYLGLSEDECGLLKEWLNGRKKGAPPNVPWSRPEDCAKWLTGEPSQPAVPEGRKFKKVPRVLKPADPEEKSAIVCFHGSDNPFGEPLSVYLLNAAAGEELGNRYFYGVAKKGMARKFPKFSRHVHVIPAEAIPLQGTNYLFIDPCGGRNFFMSWFRVVTPTRAYLYREWPGNYEITDIGLPGPWALPDGKLGDGRQGPAQDGFGFGLVRYKREIARLEGWKDEAGAKWPEGKTEREIVSGWFAENGAREVVARRFLDSRYASTPHLQDDRPVTMLENFAEIGMFFEPTPGDDVAEGIGFINDALDYDTLKPVDALNCPKLFISADCKNTIFAMETWRNKEGSKGATKDPIDNIRYFLLSKLMAVRDEDYESDGGGHY